MGTQAAGASSSDKKKTLIRRFTKNRSQRIRHGVQWLFAALNGWLGVQFFLWVRYFERGGKGLYVPRPAGVEGWLPIAGLMNTKYFLLTGHVPAIHPAAMFLFLAFLLMSLLLKKAFCSWLCPVGTLSELLWKLGRKSLRAQFAPAPLGRHSAARPEVPAARILCLRHRRHVRRSAWRVSWTRPMAWSRT